MRFLFSVVGIFVLAHHVGAEPPSQRTQVMLATYRMEHPKTSGTAFVVSRPDPAKQEDKELLLVTAAHAFEKMEGDRATLVLRKQDARGDWASLPTELAIRRKKKPLWHRHPKHDVAVLRLTAQEDSAIDSVPVTILANAEDWQSCQPDPGSLVRCIGFPHAALFKPS